VCTRGANRAVLGGPSTSPLDRMGQRHHFIQCYSRQGRVAVLVEFGLDKSQTAESPAFTELSRSIAMHIAVLNPQSAPGLLRQRYDKDPTTTVEAVLAAVSAQVGDRITITRFVRWDAQPGPPPLLEPAVAMRQRRR
jgi:translation elongation factor EF-Ts